MDENFYQQISAHIDRLTTPQERTRFLSDLAFLCERGKIPAAQKAAFLAYIRQYYVPLNRNGNLDTRCEYRMRTISEVRENSYLALGTAYDNGSNDRMNDVLAKTAADENAQYAFKTDALISMLAESLGGSNARSNVREWRALKNSNFRSLPIIAGFDAAKYEEVKADAGNPLEVRTAIVPYAELNPNRMLSLITGSILNKNYLKRDAGVKEKIRFGQANNPSSRNFSIQYPAAKERIEEIRDGMDRSLQGTFWGFLTNQQQRNNMREAHKTNYRVNFLMKDYGNGYFWSDVSRDQKNAALSFWRKGSLEYQDMETCVERLKGILQRVKNTESLSDADGRNLKELLGDLAGCARHYSRTKLNVNGRSLQVEQLTNSNTKKRVRYAIRVEQEAMELLNHLQNLDEEEKRKTDAFQRLKERTEQERSQQREENRENYFRENAIKERESAQIKAREKAAEEQEIVPQKTAEEKIREQEAKDRQRYNIGLGKYYRENEKKKYGFLPKEIAGVKNHTKESVDGRSGTYDGILVPKDFVTAAEASDLAGRVSFEKQADGKYLMMPKYPEKAFKEKMDQDGQSKRIEFSVRKNMNYLVKGMAEYCLSHSKGADGTFNAEKGLGAIRDFREEFISFSSRSGENSYEKLAGMLKIPQNEQEDFISFMKNTDVPMYFGSMTGEMAKEAETSIRYMKGAGLDRLTKQLQRAASINPASEMKIILPYNGSGNAELISYLGCIASKKGSPDDGILPAGMADYDEKLSETQKYLEKQREGIVPAKREKPMIHSVGDVILAVSQVNSPHKDPDRIREYLRSSPLITEEDRGELEPLLQKAENDWNSKEAEDLSAKFSGIVDNHREYIQKNSEYLLGIISAELELRKEEKGQKVPNGGNRNAALLGTVRYQGKDRLVVFDQPGKSSDAFSEAKIGIYNNCWELQYMPQLEEKLRPAQSIKKNENEEKVQKIDFMQLRGSQNPDRDAKPDWNRKNEHKVQNEPEISQGQEEEIPKIKRK